MKLEKYEWSENFPITEIQLEEWRKDPKKPSLLAWALNKKIIDPEQFKNWAYKHYSIPKLKSKFLEKIEKPLAREYKHLLDLNILPMRKNEGILYVACLEPTKNLPVKEQVQFLVTNFDDLQKAIQKTLENLDKPDEDKLKKVTTKPIAPPQGMIVPKNYKPNTSNIPDGLNAKLTKKLKPKTSVNNTPEGLNIKNINLKEIAKAPDGLAKNIEEKFKNKLNNQNLPDNLNIPKPQAIGQSDNQTIKKTDLRLQTPDPAPRSQLPDPRPQTPDPDPRPPITDNSSQIPAPRSQVTDNRSQAIGQSGNQAIKKTDPRSQTPDPTPSSQIPDPRSQVTDNRSQAIGQSGNQVIKKTDPRLQTPDHRSQITDNRTQIPDPSPQEAKQLKSNVVKLKPKKQPKLEDRKVDNFIGKNLPEMPKGKVHRLRPIMPKSNKSANNDPKSNSQNIDIDKFDPEFLEETLRSLDSTFDKKILFFIQEGKLLPVHWDKSFVPKNTKPLNTLNEPSIFRIAFRSKDKYFGEIYKNEINDLFFDGWMNGQYPDSITVLALKSSNKNSVFGLFLGVHKLEEASLDTLDTVGRELCHKFSAKI